MRIARIATALLAAAFALPLLVTACSDNNTNQQDADPFATLQDCFDEHHNTESLSVHDAIITCCIDHPIAGVHPSCGMTQPDCVTHVTANLSASSASSSDISTACTDYITQLAE